jgi:hypothetical protein
MFDDDIKENNLQNEICNLESKNDDLVTSQQIIEQTSINSKIEENS